MKHPEYTPQRHLHMRLIAVLLLASLLSSATAIAAQFGDFTYEVVSNEVTITDFPREFTGHVDIPAEIEGFPVTSLEQAFMFCDLTSVSIPDSVITIGNSAFSAAQSLHTVHMPDSVTHLGNSSFYQCHSLSTLRLSTNLQSIGEAAFLLNRGITSMDIPASVTCIGYRAFHECQNLASVTLREGLLFLDGWAFRGCDSLTSIVIPNSVTNLGRLVFADCPQLAEVRLGSGAAVLNGSQFNNCESLTSVVIPEGVTSISPLFGGCKSLREVSLPSTLTHIGDYSFSWCESLTTVTVPASVETIGERAFSNCIRLKSLVLPASLQAVNDRPFFGSTNLSSVILLGDAPDSFAVFDSIAGTLPADFSMYFLEGNSGFTQPTWNDYPMTMIDDEQAFTGPWLLTHDLAHDADMLEDHNLDGHTLLIAYALDLDPHNIPRGHLPQAAVSEGDFIMSFVGNSAGITYLAEQSTDLDTWSSSGVALTAPDASGMRIGHMPAIANRQFMRIVFRLGE